MFESSVILEGSKTVKYEIMMRERFESSVILEGSKTRPCTSSWTLCLRVVLF